MNKINFEEDVANIDQESLESVSSLLQQQLIMENEVEMAELELKDKKDKLRKLSEEIIPARMTELGMSSTTMVDGSKVDVVENIYVAIPKDPDKSAKKIGQKLEKYFQKDISIIISDTMGRPFRNGVVGFAIGSYNLECLRDEIGSFDLYGNDLKVTQIGIADELAASASLIMGQANEAMPLVIIRDFYKRRESKLNAQSLIRNEKEDLFR